MKDLRIYIHPSTRAASDGRAVFYSRRADGPYYRWFYEEEVGRWRCARVHLSKFTLSVLCVESLGAVPTELQTQLGEHYLE